MGRASYFIHINYDAGGIASVGNSDSFDSMGFSNPALEAIELVDVRILEPIPQEDGGTVSVQGRLRKHEKFWLNDLDVSSLVRDIILYGYRLPFAVLPRQKFKYEGLNLVPQMFDKGEHFTFDLKSGYHHVDIHIVFWTYLGFHGAREPIEASTCLKCCHLVWPQHAMRSLSYFDL